MKTESEIKDFLRQCLARLLNIEMDQIREDAQLDTDYGLSSMDSMTMGAHLEDWLGMELDVDVILRCKTVAELAENVARINGAN